MNRDVYQQIATDNDGWDSIDDADIILYRPTLLVDTTKLKAGTKVWSLGFILSKSMLEVYATEEDANNGVASETIPLKLSLVL